jgi:hypothetical protein
MNEAGLDSGGSLTVSLNEITLVLIAFERMIAKTISAVSYDCILQVKSSA